MNNPNQPQRVRTASLNFSTTTSAPLASQRAAHGGGRDRRLSLSASALRVLSESSDAGRTLRSQAFCALNGLGLSGSLPYSSTSADLAVAFDEIAVSQLAVGSDSLKIEPLVDAAINSAAEPLDCASITMQPGSVTDSEVSQGDVIGSDGLVVAFTVSLRLGWDTSESESESGRADAEAAAQLFYARASLLFEAALAVAEQGMLANVSELVMDPPLHVVNALASGQMSVDAFDAESSADGSTGDSIAGNDSSPSTGRILGLAIGVPLGIALVAIVLVALALVMRRKRSSASGASAGSPSQTRVRAQAGAQPSSWQAGPGVPAAVPTQSVTAASAPSESVLATGTSILSPRSAALTTRARGLGPLAALGGAQAQAEPTWTGSRAAPVAVPPTGMLDPQAAITTHTQSEPPSGHDTDAEHGHSSWHWHADGESNDPMSSSGPASGSSSGYASGTAGARSPPGSYGASGHGAPAVARAAATP